MRLMTARQEIVVYFVVPDDASDNAIQGAGDDAMRRDLEDNPAHHGTWCSPAVPDLYEGGWEAGSRVYGTKRGEPEITLGEAMAWVKGGGK